MLTGAIFVIVVTGLTLTAIAVQYIITECNERSRGDNDKEIEMI